MDSGYNSQSPLPLPRAKSPTTNFQKGSNPVAKKPVPLPRKILMDSSAAKKASTPEKSSPDDKKSVEVKIKSNGYKEDTLAKSYNTLTKSLKNEFKSASDSVHEKSKAVIEGTKNVSARLEKSVRGILTRRPSNVSSSTRSIEQVPEKFERCHSLPGEEIFHSISFDSPLTVEESVTNDNSNYDSDFEDSMPPPSFPPPPPPDESLYDEVQSVRSSNSGGHSYENYALPGSSVQSDCGSYYEEVPILKKLSIFQDSDSDKSLNSDSARSLVEERKNCRRSDSWSFYDTVDIVPRPKSEPYENVVLPQVKFSSVNNIYTQCPSNAATVGSEQDTITNRSLNSEDTDGAMSLSSSDDCSVTQSNASRRESTASSISVANELYNNWDPISRMKEVNKANARQREQNKRLFPSKSVIIEFDPLYENVLYSALEGESAPQEYNESELSHSPRYSTIESEQESDEDDPAPLPVPPERVDSISQLSSSSASVKNIPNDVEYYLYHRTKDKQSGNIEIKPTFEKKQSDDVKPSASDQVNENTNVPPSEDVSSSSSSVSPDREGSPGKRRTNLVRWTSMKRAIKAVADTTASHWSPNVIRRMSKSNAKTEQEPLKYDFLEKPMLDPSSSHLHGGFVFRSPSGGEKPKDFTQRWCQLGEGKLTFSSEKNAGNGKDFISLDSISSIQIVRDVKYSGDGEDVHCMEVLVLPRARSHLLGSPGTTERRIWMQKILESLTSIFPARITADYTRAGWCYLKEGVSGDWMASWILLCKRSLYYSQSNNKLKEIDLRKARCVVLHDSDKNSGCSRASEEGPHILVDTPDQSLYLQMDAARETKSWRQNIRAAAVDNGPNLSDQQLSRNDVPVIVEKCINFVYAHGLMSEGIYRRSGANSSVTKLLTLFQKDAWAVQLSRQDYTEYDVSNVLKRFFRDLPEPVFTAQLHKHLCNTVGLKCTEEEKLSVYRTQLEQLPVVNYLTIRLLLSHLYALHQQRERNLMPVDNLAAIWAPTLMHVENTLVSGEINWSKREAEVVSELISLYPKLFMVDNEEIDRERRMQEVLEKYHNSTTQQHPQMAPPAGDLRIWIHVGARDSANCVQITVGPQLTAGEVCISLCEKLKSPANKLCLMEMVLNGSLHRPLHHSEQVLDSVLRWGYWDDADCKNNCLVLTHNTMYEEVTPLIKHSVPKSGELKFADQKSKSFKTYVFEFSQANLSYYKDKAGAQKLGEWRIEDIIWYFGYEPKRNPNMRWAITFISKNNKVKRSKEFPYFGCTIAGTSREEQLKWVAAMLVGQYPHNNILPPPQHVNLLE